MAAAGDAGRRARTARMRAGTAANALGLLWEDLARAQNGDDVETLAEISRLAHVIIVHGDHASAAGAQRLLAGIGTLHPEVLEDADAGAGKHSIPITTGNDLPGQRIVELIGPLFAMTVRSRDAFTQWGARLKGGTVGGELAGMTQVTEQSRTQVLVRLHERALQVKADGIIALRFEVSEMAGMWTEICVYGTAVRVSDETTRPRPCRAGRATSV